MATILTDGNLVEIATGPELVIFQPPEILAAMDDWNTKHHGGSGLVDRVKASTVTEADAEAQTIAFINAHVPAKDRPVLAGNSIHQDRRFIRKYMPVLEKRLHYRMVDVSTIKELARRWFPAQITGRSSSQKKETPPGARRHPRVDRRAWVVLSPARVLAGYAPSHLRPGCNSVCGNARRRNAPAAARRRLLERVDAYAFAYAWLSFVRSVLARSPPACSTSPTDDGDPRVTGSRSTKAREDNLSSSQDALEYTLEGKLAQRHARTRATRTKTDAERMAAAKKLIGYKQIALAWFVTQYFVDKEDDDANFHFGGFGGMAKGGMWKTAASPRARITWTYSFHVRTARGGPGRP